MLVSVSCTHDSSSAAAFEVELKWNPAPPSIGINHLELALRSPDHRPIAGAIVRLEGNMSHAGMKPSFADAREIAPGAYAADFEFTMAGDWYLIVGAQLAGGQRVEQSIPIPSVKPR